MTFLPSPASCQNCAFTTRDLALLANHSCEVSFNGGLCEDFPCCGHESGDCNGLLYGSDEAIKAEVREAWDVHGYCDHAEGIYACEDARACDDEDCHATGTCLC